MKKSKDMSTELDKKQRSLFVRKEVISISNTVEPVTRDEKPEGKK